ncbi:hypothetical protein [Neobacillus sp. 204]
MLKSNLQKSSCSSTKLLRYFNKKKLSFVIEASTPIAIHAAEKSLLHHRE